MKSIHDIMPRVALWLAPLFALFVGIGVWAMIKYFQLPEGVAVFELVEGQWGWTADDCAHNPHTITIADDSTTMTLADTSGSWVYDILEHEPARIRGAIRGEKRLTDRGVPVVWDLLLRGPNLYTWHRTDWPGLQTTQLIMRCGKRWNAQ